MNERVNEWWIEDQLHALAAPHPFQRRRWRPWLCDLCHAPRSLHPRTDFVLARPPGANAYLSADAPHFKEGW